MVQVKVTSTTTTRMPNTRKQTSHRGQSLVTSSAASVSTLSCPSSSGTTVSTTVSPAMLDASVCGFASAGVSVSSSGSAISFSSLSTPLLTSSTPASGSMLYRVVIVEKESVGPLVFSAGTSSAVAAPGL